MYINVEACLKPKLYTTGKQMLYVVEYFCLPIPCKACNKLDQLDSNEGHNKLQILQNSCFFCWILSFFKLHDFSLFGKQVKQKMQNFLRRYFLIFFLISLHITKTIMQVIILFHYNLPINICIRNLINLLTKIFFSIIFFNLIKLHLNRSITKFKNINKKV